jgi:hypothetical protein
LQFGDIQIVEGIKLKKNGVTMVDWKNHMHEFEQQPEEANLQNPQPEMEIPDVH